jgi:hypothetical protein
MTGTGQMVEMAHDAKASSLNHKPASHAMMKMGNGQAEHGMMKMGAAEVSRSKLSQHKYYKVSIAPQTPPLAINVMHGWVLQVDLPDGHPLQGAEILVNGGMLAHGHGLPT